MPSSLTRQFIASFKRARTTLARLTPEQKRTLEKTWDIEHAYYSSALEGSQIDKQEFEKLGQKMD